jgi:guanylate kinase
MGMANSCPYNPWGDATVGHVFVLSGASSVGKTTFLLAIQKLYGRDQINVIPRHTERPKRPGEEDDFEYFFLDHRQFLQKVYAHDFIHVERWGNYYTGIDRNSIEDALSSNQAHIVLASTFGAARLRASYKTGITHLYMWTGDNRSLMSPRCMELNSPEIQELIFRIKKKNLEKGFSEQETKAMISEIFVEKRMVDNFVDIAAVNGRLRNREDIHVLPNLRDNLGAAVSKFVDIWKSTSLIRNQPQTAETSGCFVLMPFREEMNPIYDDHIASVCSELSLKSLRADKIFSTNPIIDDIKESVSNAQVIIADLTENNPNVFYEVGICHAIGKNVILITQNHDIPFDVRHLRCLIYKYTPRGMKEFEDKLRSTLSGIVDR